MQGGFQSLLNNNTEQKTISGYKMAKVYPFASATFNVLNFNKQPGYQTRLMVYLSYAKTFTALPEINTSLKNYGVNTINTAVYIYKFIGYNIYNPLYNPYKTYDEVQAGVTLSLLKNKISFSYNYNVLQYSASYLTRISYLSGFIYFNIYRDTRLDIHNFNLDLQLLHTTNFNWESNLNTTFIKGAYNHNELIGYNYNFDTPYQSSGSFYNKFNYKQAFLGVALVYRLHGQLYVYDSATTSNINSFDVQYVYAGCKLNVGKLKNFEVFANARNLFQNPASDITDNRRFYGLGFKLGL